MMILWETLGNAQHFNMADPLEKENFIFNILQTDEDDGEEFIARLAEEGEIVRNLDEPIFIERFTVA